MNAEAILLTRHWVRPLLTSAGEPSESQRHAALTVIANLAHYGYAPSPDLMDQLLRAAPGALEAWWPPLDAALADHTAANRQMAEFVVYKNFPREVLDMSALTYWRAQILMYLGCPSAWFAEIPQDRAPLSDAELRALALRPLAVSPAGGLGMIWDDLRQKPSAWSGQQLACAAALWRHSAILPAPAQFGYRLNGLALLVRCWPELGRGQFPHLTEATDVLRLASMLSGGDGRLAGRVEFKLTRQMRRVVLAMLESIPTLAMEVAQRKVLWKRFFERVHPGEYNVPQVQAVMRALCAGDLRSRNSQLERLLADSSQEALTMLSERPGEMLRRFRECYTAFGSAAVSTLRAVMPKLSVMQLLKLKAYLRTANLEAPRIIPPGGRWAFAKLVQPVQAPIQGRDLCALKTALAEELAARAAEQYPEGVALTGDLATVKLPTNNQELASYGPGTVFSLPDEAQFLRTASYWQNKDHTCWFDNGWVFFDEHWTPMGACCWNTQCNDSHPLDAASAIFSGDPINSADLEGRACQLLDLNLPLLKAGGVRYAVWSILSYNEIPFAETDDLVASLQWGVDPQAGALYEPSRAQMVFPIKGRGMAKQVALLDLDTRELMYLDANLGVSLGSAGNPSGQARLQEQLPALLAYIKGQPTYADYFEAAPVGSQQISREDCLLGRVTISQERVDDR